MSYTNLDSSKLCRQVIYGDGVAGNLVETIPVTAEGYDDLVRQRAYSGQTFLNTNKGQINLTWSLNATSFPEALSEWIVGLDAEIEKLKSEQVKAQILSGVGQRPSRPNGA
jgi:hypothetical protein